MVRRPRVERVGNLPDHRERLRPRLIQPQGLPTPIGISAARGVPAALRALDGHRFLVDDVSIVAPDVPDLAGYRQVTDAHLLTLARRSEMRLVTFDTGIRTLADERDVELLTAL